MHHSHPPIALTGALCLLHLGLSPQWFSESEEMFLLIQWLVIASSGQGPPAQVGLISQCWDFFLPARRGLHTGKHTHMQLALTTFGLGCCVAGGQGRTARQRKQICVWLWP